jgi:mannose-6-phosphate isomerase-like protein (cupin superfamily)
MKISPSESKLQLPFPATAKWLEGVWDVEALRHGSMSLVYFAPSGKDYQSTHDQDELYIILKGQGVIEIQGIRTEFREGDALFVAGGKHHNFVQYEVGTEMWALFYGPKGGE